MNRWPILVFVFIAVNFANGQEQEFFKEYVRSFSLRQSDTILIELSMPYEIIDWDKEIVRTFTQIESFSLPSEFHRKLLRKGRYSMYGKRKNNVLRIHMPEVHHAITVNGIRLTEEIVAQIYVPKKFPVKVICNSKTPEQQVEDLWLQQEVLTRKLKYPIKKAINSDFYDLVKFEDAVILAANTIKGTKRFLELSVEANGKKYSVISRIGKLYEAKNLIGKEVVFVKHSQTPELKKLPNDGMVLVQENEKGELGLIEKKVLPEYLF